MTLEEFKNELLGLELTQLKTLYREHDYMDWTPHKPDPTYNWRTKKYNEDKDIQQFDALYVEWETGGTSGGSCWDDSDPRPYSTNALPEELTDLDIILEHFKPDLTFLQYRKLTNSLIKISSRHESEYYGNGTDYSSRFIIIDHLYKYLNDEGFLSGTN